MPLVAIRRMINHEAGFSQCFHHLPRKRHMILDEQYAH
jgi:hypothetical protein